MTKKEIEDGIWSNKEINTIGKVEAQNAIDLMQDDFESRTCENCKYIGCVYMLTAYETDGYTAKEFGCNQYEDKDK